ncbi:LysR family transcriptional regulator [Undibacterium sp. KW1]|uniref:LysR family transcriptional regulator n=1 Tax=Undibacterium sp. KW1 TaxID=2058624 RepID=UPI001331CEE4|nr:LysR family transcriptional regulator [Undibacterium sp. KW1]BBB60593.1 LysR family transcriptional regulator [Undibacterium sp. KW1]
MDDKNIHWDYYRTALAVLEEGSLSGAARALGLTQPTVGRHIEALEQALGTSLFVRNQSGLSPTIAALAMKPYAESLRATESALLRSVSAEANEVRGKVRITASEVMGVEILPGMLAGLRQNCPELSIELQISNHTQDLLKRDADIAIRMTEPLQDALIARRTGNVTLGFFAHVDYLSRHGVPSDMSALKQHSVIGFDREFPYIRALQKRYPQLQGADFALGADSDLVQFAAIRKGYGIGICQVGLAQQHSYLQRVLADELQIDLPVWVVMHEDLRSSQRYRTTFDHLVKELQALLQQV